MAAKPFGELGPPPNPFGFRLVGLPPMRSPGGWFVQASRSDFPMSLTLIGAITYLEADGIREPHWHPNADEWDLVLEGRALITLFDGPDQVRAIEVGPGDIGFLPRNQAHAVAALDGKPFLLLSVFNASEFLSIGISEVLAALPESLLARNLPLPADSIARLPKGQRFIVRRA
jgi:oxalate decarboxylase